MLKIKTENGISKIFSPYNPTFVKQVKGIGGARWNGSERCWEIPEEHTDVARELMRNIYGYSDTEPNQTVKLRVTFNESEYETCSSIVLFGKVIASATGRDSGARFDDDVAYTQGMAKSGGSARNWHSEVESGSVIIMHNVNKELYEREKDNLKYNVTVELLGEVKNRQGLLEEKQRLLKRIEEIDKLLEEKEV